jgi:uncharacterized protein YjiS (DUF1127 family)
MDGKRSFEAEGTHATLTFPNRDNIERHLVRSRRLQVQATAAMLPSGARTIARLLRRAAARLARAQRQRRTYHALMRCSDRVLADIGIERAAIPLVAKGIDPRAYHERAPRGWWRPLGTRLDAASRAWRERRRIYRELMAYNDRELDDLGIRRTDIPVIARGRLPAPV